MRRVISILVENQPGALSRISGLFSARGYNIESLTVAPTQDPTLSRVTIVTEDDRTTVEQITKNLNKLVETYRVNDLTETNYLERELMIVKVKATGEMRDEMKRLSEIFRSTIINVTPETYIIQVTGVGRKLDAFIAAVGNKNIIEIARTGVCGMSRS